VNALTIGQYLRPARANQPVSRYVTPDQFRKLGDLAKSLGFRFVASAPLVRSSYMARELIESC